MATIRQTEVGIGISTIFCRLDQCVRQVVLGAGGGNSSLSGSEAFVTIDGEGDFVAGCSKFFFAGWNQCENPQFVFLYLKSICLHCHSVCLVGSA